MATLRLFASIREAAGTGTEEIDAPTVGAVIDAASERYGPGFTALLGTCRIWLNGEPADRSDIVGVGDEVAVLPPVSGGA
ncbi:MAG: MoaD/ThiS family protein [Acidimicrobiales bacterium]